MSLTEGHTNNIVNASPNMGGGPTVQWHYAGTDRTYGVQLNWQSPGIEKSMYYNVRMVCSGVKGDDAVWEISKGDIYIDNQKSEDLLELLAMACAAPCYPFLFSANKGGYITSLLNPESIKRRFIEAQPTLQRDFGGDVAAAYIKAMIVALGQPQQLKKIISADAFLAMFFSDITGQYDQQKTKSVTVNCPFFGFDELLSFNGTATIGKPNFDTKSQAIIVKAGLGPSAEPQADKMLNGILQATYDIDIPGHMIKNVSAQIEVTTAAAKHQLWLNAYRINAETIVPALQPIKQDEPKPKRRFSIF